MSGATDAIQRAADRLRGLLQEAEPEATVVRPVGGSDRSALVSLPGETHHLCFEYSASVFPKQIAALAERTGDAEGGVPVLVTSRLTRGSFDRCRELGVWAIDLCGNMFLSLRGIYVERYVDSKPPRCGRSAGTVFTAKGSRIVRALLADASRRWSQAELVEATGVTSGYVSTRVRLLLQGGYCRTRLNLISVAEPDRLLDDWRAAYRFDRHRAHAFAMSMASYEQGLGRLSDELLRCGVRFAFTGWSGAFLRAPYGTSDALMAYVDRVPAEQERRVLHPVQRQGNVTLLVPQDDGVFQFTEQSVHGEVVSDAQLFLDLSNMPGRAVEQADVVREQFLHFSETDR